VAVRASTHHPLVFMSVLHVVRIQKDRGKASSLR